VQRYNGNFAKCQLTPFSGLTTLGKTLAGLSAAVILFGGALILFDASHFDLERDQTAVVIGKTVNVRSQPTTRSKFQARVHAGYRFTVTGSEGKWKNVQTTDGKLEGWIASSLPGMNTGKTFVYRYEQQYEYQRQPLNFIPLPFLLVFVTIHGLPPRGLQEKSPQRGLF
jgi:hypothetical protein